MKVIAIIGSPHKNGNTARLTRLTLKGLADSSIETEEIFLPDYRIDYCRGCIGSNGNNCMNTGKCCIDDDVNDLRERMVESDGIILASPAYGIRPYAMMKNFITDRIGMFAAYTSLFAGKYIAGLATAGGIGASNVAKQLAHEFASDFHERSYVSGHLGVLVGHGKIEDNPRMMKKAYTLGLRMAEDMLKKRKHPLHNLLKRILFRIFVRRILLNNILKNKNGHLKAVYENILARRLIKAR
jgi:multimeric flavodoxin WrbA